MFPGGVEDCVKTLDWLVDHADELGVDATRIAVAGDSAGGSLSNAVVLEGSHADRIKAVVELYPLVVAVPFRMSGPMTCTRSWMSRGPRR